VKCDKCGAWMMIGRDWRRAICNNCGTKTAPAPAPPIGRDATPPEVPLPSHSPETLELTDVGSFLAESAAICMEGGLTLERFWDALDGAALTRLLKNADTPPHEHPQTDSP
jgi:hypothetical protein